MNTKSALVLIITMVLMATPLTLLTPETRAENWTQTSYSDFQEGESFFVDIGIGNLKLTRTLSEEWTAVGEAASDYFGTSVASAGDVNGDGYEDVIVGAFGNAGNGSNAGETYVYHGSSSGLSSSPDWSDQGETAGDYFGSSVAAAGDVNGDGYDDVIVGACYNDDGGSNSGEAYVYYGSSVGLAAAIDWSDQGEAESDYFGCSVASAGDVNGDGYADVIVGAYSNDDGGGSAGEAYVYYGSSSGLSAGPDWSDQGEAVGDQLGYSVAAAGDVNGDGYDDVIVGAHRNDDGGSDAGEAYVYHGSSSGLSASPDWSGQGEAVEDYFGISVAAAGDVNGDGYADVIVGAYLNDDAGNAAGEAYIYHGSSSGLSVTPDWSDQGEAASDAFGKSVASAGDVNGDGYDDVIVGAYGNSDGGSMAGEAYVYHGSSSGLSASPDWVDQGETAGDYFGASVAAAGDVNGDGYADVIVGVPNDDDGGTQAGKAYLYSYGLPVTLSNNEDWSDQGEAANDYFGESVAAAGDVNGDGYADVIVGAYSNDGGGNNAGEAYVYYGSSSGLSATPDWSDQGEAADDKFGFSVAAAGDVNGDGYDDVIVGAYYNDGGGSAAGEAYVYHGSSSGLSATPDWADQGEAASDWFGKCVAAAGDVNSDGYDDVIVGAIYNDGGGSAAGEAYVYHGSSSGLSASPDWSDQGEAVSDRFGVSVASARDVNGDGYADVIVGARYNDGGGMNAGEAYVYQVNDYIWQGTYESRVFDIDGTEGVNWCKLSWGSVSQPDGTTIKAQIATSDDGATWNWRGPDGSSTSYYTNGAGQEIYSGEQGEALRVRFVLENEYREGSSIIGNKPGERTPTLTDFTVSYLKFTKPTVALNWPNGGENLMHGESYPVTWDTTGDLDTDNPVALSFSLNGGSSWTDISTATANDGLYVWTLPSNQDVERALVKVVATAPDGSTIEDTSDRPFSIDPPPVNPETGDRVISPTAGEELEKGSTVVVEWQLAGEETVSLHYSTDFGQSWQPVVENILNLGSYHWELPDDMSSEHVVLKVKGAEQEVVSNLFIVGEGGAEDEKETKEEDSQRIPAVLGSLTALLIICFVVLILVVRHDPGKGSSSSSDSARASTSQEKKHE